MTMEKLTERIQTPGGFFHFQLRDVLMICALIGGIWSFMLTRETGVVRQSEQIGQLRETIKDVAAQIATTNISVGTLKDQYNALDKKGTEHEQNVMNFFAQKDSEHDRRLTTLEGTLAQVVPDVREIKTQVKLVADMLAEKGKK